jgi:hypothetical protein
MIASELMEELKTRVPDALILVREGHSVARITSVLKNKPPEPVLLIGEPIEMGMGQASHILSEAMGQGVGKGFNVKFIPSVHNPGKFQVSIDGVPAWPGEFDTQNEAKAFMRGFTFGFSVGGGIKNIADGLPSRLT